MSPISATLPIQATHATQPGTRRVDIAQRFDFTGSAGKVMMQSAVIQREMNKKGHSSDYVDFVNELSSQVVRTQMAMQTIKTYAKSAEAANDWLAHQNESNDFNAFRVRTPEAPPPQDETAAEAPIADASGDASTAAARIASAYQATSSSAPTTQHFEAYA